LNRWTTRATTGFSYALSASATDDKTSAEVYLYLDNNVSLD